MMVFGLCWTFGKRRRMSRISVNEKEKLKCKFRFSFWPKTAVVVQAWTETLWVHVGSGLIFFFFGPNHSSKFYGCWTHFSSGPKQPLMFFLLSLICVQVRDAQQDSQPAVRPAARVVLPGLWHVSEAPEQTGGGHGETHQSHWPPQTGEERWGAEGNPTAGSC